jgi:cytochrome c oxidase assembly protein subunit 19
MSGRSMGAGRQTVSPPQRGIFPLDHLAECRGTMERYLQCLAENSDIHHKCQNFSKAYLQCRMDRELMSKEDLDNLGFAETVEGAREYDNSREKAGFVAGQHIGKQKWWWQ